MSTSQQFGRCALLIAHPGHEIRVHGWLEVAKPKVYVLTDGSGRCGQSRLASTTRLLALAGARPGSLYGRYRDREIYEAVLQGDAALFCALATELAQELEREQIEFVLGDAEEGAILAHDVWRGVINAAVSAAQSRLVCPIANFEFDLEGQPGRCPPEIAAVSLWHRLDDGALARKIAAAREYTELHDEVEAAFAAYGEAAFRTECLRPVQLSNTGVTATQITIDAPAIPTGRRTKPAYELHGEALAAAGIYPAAVQYERHVLPLLAALAGRERAA